MLNKIKKLVKGLLNLLLNKKKKTKIKEESILDYHIHPTALLYGKERIHIDKTALIAEYVIARVPVGKLLVGSNSQIGPFTVIFTSASGVEIGNNVMIAPHCVIASGSHNHTNIDSIRHAPSITNGPIIIEDDVWIGSNCTITDNVKIGKGAVVGANSIVNKDVLAYSIVGGVPAKFISSRIK